ncbi:TPA: hypothetical protein ACNTQP_004723, partial [Escherichia coli]
LIFPNKKQGNLRCFFWLWFSVKAKVRKIRVSSTATEKSQSTTDIVANEVIYLSASKCLVFQSLK